jgi:hypothetical protein
MADLKIGLQPVYEFDALDRHYRIVRTSDIHWLRSFGFKPRQPYVLLDPSNTAVNGVTEQDLEWYRLKYGQPETVRQR